MQDADEKRRLKSIPTRLQLPEEDVALLIVAARNLLVESEEYQALLADLGATRESRPPD